MGSQYSYFSSQSNNSMKLHILLCSILAFISLGQCMEIPQELADKEQLAFEMCESDKMFGLTWIEVERCEERFANEIKDMDIDIPSEEDFHEADLDGNGTLMFEEWEEWVKLQEIEELSEDDADNV